MSCCATEPVELVFQVQSQSKSHHFIFSTYAPRARSPPQTFLQTPTMFRVANDLTRINEKMNLVIKKKLYDKIKNLINEETILFTNKSNLLAGFIFPRFPTVYYIHS